MFVIYTNQVVQNVRKYRKQTETQGKREVKSAMMRKSQSGKDMRRRKKQDTIV